MFSLLCRRSRRASRRDGCRRPAFMPVLGFMAFALMNAPVHAQSVSSSVTDPTLQALIEEAFASNPDLAAARKRVDAETQRVPQAGALPDPSISIGYQNDGFDSIELGRMETTWFTIMGSQPLPWPGKRALRKDVARQGVKQTELALERIRLSLEAEVRRAYVDLLLTRDRLKLLESQEALWKRAEEVTRTRYKVGEGAQSDLLRTQLELHRLKQRRWALAAEERATLAALNRLRAHPLDEAIPTPVPLEQLGDPALSPLPEAMAFAETKSPEIAQASVGVTAASQQLELARKELYPDFAVNAGVMPRGGLEPMWQVGVSVSLPVFSSQKQQRAVVESDARRQAKAQDQESVRLVLQLRVKERHERLDALLQANRLYREGLLVLSETTTQSTLNQYAVGRVPFASVLEAMNGFLADRDQYLQSIAETWRIAIAQDEVSLAPVAGLDAGMTGSAMPGTSSGSPATRSSGGGAGGASTEPSSTPGMSM